MSSSPSIMAWMNSRTRSRRPASIGSNQWSKRWTAVSAAGCEDSSFVVMLVMAWSPVRRFNAGCFEVDHPGDYATLNSYQPRDGICDHSVDRLERDRTAAIGGLYHSPNRRFRHCP